MTKDDIRLIAQSSKKKPVIVENPGTHDQGIAIARSGAAGPGCLTDPTQRIQRARVQGFTVNGFGSEGIFLFCVDQWRVQANTTNDNAEYGIFPSHCGAGTIIKNTATGSNDTGIYIGQSHDVRVDHNLATGNVSGFEIENSSNVRLDHNESTGNTGGILSFTLPGLDVPSNHDNRIDHNNSHDNNKANTCLHPGGLHHRVDPDRDIGKKCQGSPPDLVNLADRLRREFRCRRDHQDVGAGGLQLDDLGVDGRILHLVGRSGDE